MINQENMSLKQRLERLDTMLAEGRIIRKKWTDTDGHGRELACLLAAISPEAGERGTASACPAAVMPAWLAYLTPEIDDNVSVEYWPKMLLRYAALAHRWHTLDDEAWHRAEYRFRATCVREAMQHTDDERVLKCCRVSLSLCEREIAGDSPTIEEWRAAKLAAYSAASAASAAARGAAMKDTERSAARAARDAASTAWAAAYAPASVDASASAVNTAANTANTAADAAEAAAYAAAGDAANTAAEAATYAAAEAAYSAARLEVWDLIAVVVFESIETEIEKMK